MAISAIEIAKLSCVICGGANAKLTYGSVICPSCRVFFIRNTKKINELKCDYDNNCPISTQARMNCTACRYQKCLQAGMMPAEVGKNQQLKKAAVQYLSGLHYNQNISEFALCLLPSGLNNISRLENASNASEFTEILCRFENWSINPSGKSASDIPVDLNFNLVDILMNPTLCSSREASSWDNRLLDYVNSKRLFSYKNTYCRFATMLTDFLSSLPEYHYLCTEDKIKLFQQSFPLVTMISMFYARYRAKIKIINVTERIDRFDMAPEDKESFRNFLIHATVSFDTCLRLQFEELELTDPEWALLKIICMFSSTNTFSEEGAKVVLSSKMTYCSILGKLIAEMYPYLTEEKKIDRFRRLLSTVHKHATMGNQFYGQFISENRGNLRGTLSYDIHMKHFK